MSNFTANLIDEAGYVNPRAVADEFRCTIKEVALFSGLSVDTVGKKARFRSNSSQKRLRDIVLILNRALPWCGSPIQAYAWYRSEPLPAFGDLTPEDLVKRGMADSVLEEMTRIADGGFA